MELTRYQARVVVGATIGAGLGAICGGITAAAAAHGDSSIRSDLGVGAVFLLSFVGWTLSAGVISYLWKHAHGNRSANWVGIISAIPLAVTSLLVAVPRAELPSVSELVVFVIGDVIIGVVVAQTGLQHFGKVASISRAEGSREAE